MPKANTLAQIAKKLASLQAKSAKINEEIKALAGMVEVELNKQEATRISEKTTPATTKATTAKASSKTVAQKPIVKKTPATSEPKKRGKPAKVKVEEKPDYLSMLNADPASKTPAKKRDKK
jgi:hypothetical protein